MLAWCLWGACCPSQIYSGNVHVSCMLATLCLQRGIDLPTLDVTYFTSLSYYMLLLFGLRGVMSLFFKEDTIDETQVGCCTQSRSLSLLVLERQFWWLLVSSRRQI